MISRGGVLWILQSGQMTQDQKFQKVKAIFMELNGTSSVIDYPKLKIFIIWKFLDGTYWILQDGHLPWLQKCHALEVLGLVLWELKVWKITMYWKLSRGGCSWDGSYWLEVTGSSKVNKSLSSEVSQDGNFGNRT